MEEKKLLNAAFVVKDEWPLLALTVSHALLRYADNVLIMDTGSTDGTFAGLEELKQYFPNRIHTYILDHDGPFDQAPLANILLSISETLGGAWTVFLDADEFLYAPNYDELKKVIFEESGTFIAVAVPVSNYAPNERFQEIDIDSIHGNFFQLKTLPYQEYSEEYLFEQITNKKDYLISSISTPDKLIVKNCSESFISQGNHQILFGDGIYWKSWDGRAATAASLGWRIFHLPFTSLRRFENRLKRNWFDGKPMMRRLSFVQNPKDAFNVYQDLCILQPEKLERMKSQKKIEVDPNFEDEMSFLTMSLSPLWEKIVCKQYSLESKLRFKSSIETLTLKKLVRKYHDKATYFWKDQNKRDVVSKSLQVNESENSSGELSGPFVFLIGFNKTATRAFTHLFEESSFPSIHWDKNRLVKKMIENLAEGKKILAGYDHHFRFYSDFIYVSPEVIIEGNQFFQIMASDYPDAFFILNNRSTEDWIRSRAQHDDGEFLALQLKILGSQNPQDAFDLWRKQKEEHEDSVRNYFLGKRNFLEVDIQDPDKIHKISRFLGINLDEGKLRVIGRTEIDPPQMSKNSSGLQQLT